jgi:hypothetical protein
VERNRNDEVRFFKQRAPSGNHPTREGLETVTPSLMFEGQDQIARHVIVGQCGPRPVKRRRIRQAGPASLVEVDGKLERKPAARADRRRQESQSAPEIWLYCAWTGNLPTRDQGPLRPDQIGGPFQRPGD